MKLRAERGNVLINLVCARQVANYAIDLGIISNSAEMRRPTYCHLGAALADAILQAGLNYRTVVKGRVDRIIQFYPETSELSGVLAVVESERVAGFLLWKHPEKIRRFIAVAHALRAARVANTSELKCSLEKGDLPGDLLTIKGIGPKTVDYLGCLVGVDRVAIDRRMRSFAGAAGVGTSDYDALRDVLSYAADLIGISRREFDAWVWRIAPTTSASIGSVENSDRQLLAASYG